MVPQPADGNGYGEVLGEEEVFMVTDSEDEGQFTFFRTAERTETVVVVVTGCDFVVLSRILRSQKLRTKFDSQVVCPKYHG